jgi:hypothetical protein
VIFWDEIVKPALVDTASRETITPESSTSVLKDCTEEIQDILQLKNIITIRQLWSQNGNSHDEHLNPSLATQWQACMEQAGRVVFMHSNPATCIAVYKGWTTVCKPLYAHDPKYHSLCSPVLVLKECTGTDNEFLKKLGITTLRHLYKCDPHDVIKKLSKSSKEETEKIKRRIKELTKQLWHFNKLTYLCYKSGPLSGTLQPNVSLEDVTIDSNVDVLSECSEFDKKILDMLGITTFKNLLEYKANAQNLAVSLGHVQDSVVAKLSKIAKELRLLQNEYNASPSTSDSLIVWHYVNEAVYQQIKEDRFVKSAYVLFNEYMECEPQQRPFHAWKRVHHSYVRYAAKWMGRKNVDLNTVTDADVYAFLVWRASFSFGQFDCTAGPKAIYFSWTKLADNVRDMAIAVDEVMAEDSRNPYLADRFKRVVGINIGLLHTKYGAKIHRVETSKQNPSLVDSNHWIPTPIQEAALWCKKENLWEQFEAGVSDFQSVPHGCVVLSKGMIPIDCVVLDDKDDEL